MRTRLALARQPGQRWGTFWSPFSSKKRCSPLEKMKLSPQSRQVSVRSSNTEFVLRRGSHVLFRSPTRPVLLRTGLEPEPAGEDTGTVKRCDARIERRCAVRCGRAPGMPLGNRRHPFIVSRAMTDSTPASGTPRPARTLSRRPAAAASLVFLLAACNPAGGTPGPSSGPSAGPSDQPTPTAVAGIEHPTGAKDVVLRFEEGGGFVPIDFIATQAPSFTLYGDGTVVFRDGQAPPPDAVGSVIRSVPFQTVKIDEEGIQALLEYALG